MLTAMTEEPPPRARVKLVPVDGVSVPTECRHCDAAACVSACPTGAVYKESAHGPVMLKNALCVGCGSCVVACPYGVIRQRFDTQEVYKCDLCAERLAEDLVPACADACPTGCLTFKADSELHSWLKDVGVAQAEMVQQQAAIKDQA